MLVQIALLQKQGSALGFAQACGADLGLDASIPHGHQHPDNMWTLKGYHQYLTRLGGSAEANRPELPLMVAQSIGDVAVVLPCYCSREMLVVSQIVQLGRERLRMLSSIRLPTETWSRWFWRWCKKR